MVDPIWYARPYTPGLVTIRTRYFIVLCVLAALGAFTLILILLGV